MARRSIDWNEGLSRDLKDAKFAQAFIQASLTEGISIQAVLAKVIRAYGVKEFATKIKMPSSNLLRAINTKHNLTINTLNRLLKPFSLELTLAPSSKKQAA